MVIEDGGSTGRKATVSSSNRVNVSAKTQPRAFYVSRDDGRAFNAIYDNMTAAAGDRVAYMKNTSSDRLIVVDVVEFHAAENVKWKIFSVSGTAADGAAVLATNLNLQSGIPANGSYMSGDTPITGLTDIAQIGTHRTPAAESAFMDFHGALILGPGDAICVEYDAGTTGLCAIEIIHHFETIGAT